MNQIDNVCARLAGAQPALRALLRSPDVQAAAEALGLQPHQLAALATTGRALFGRLCPGAEGVYERLREQVGRFEPFVSLGGELVLAQAGGGCDGSCGGSCGSCRVPGGPQLPPPSTTPPSTTPPSTTPPSTTPPDPCVPGVSPALTPMDFNCRSSAPDMVPCRAARVMSEESIFDASRSWNSGVLFAGGIVALLLPPVGISSRLCVDSIGAVLTSGGTPTALPLTWVALQSQILTLDPQGQAVQAWTSYRPARPGQISATDGRCPCARVCVCHGYASMVRVLLRVPAIGATDTLTVTVGGYREEWGTPECGPCPPCAICDLTPLSEFELTSASKYELVYVPEAV